MNKQSKFMSSVQKFTSKEFDWSLRPANTQGKFKNCKFVLSKKFVRLAVLRNKLKRTIRHLSFSDCQSPQECCFFRIKVAVTKENCASIVLQIRDNMSATNQKYQAPKKDFSK